MYYVIFFFLFSFFLLFGNQLIKQRLQALCALLGEPLLPILIINIRHSKSRHVAIRPLKVVHQRPGEIALDVYTVQRHGCNHGSDVVVVILDSEFVLQNLLLGQVVFSLDTGAVLRHVNPRVVVSLADPDEEIAEASWARA